MRVGIGSPVAHCERGTMPPGIIVSPADPVCGTVRVDEVLLVDDPSGQAGSGNRLVRWFDVQPVNSRLIPANMKVRRVAAAGNSTLDISGRSDSDSIGVDISLSRSRI